MPAVCLNSRSTDVGQAESALLELVASHVLSAQLTSEQVTEAAPHGIRHLLRSVRGSRKCPPFLYCTDGGGGQEHRGVRVRGDGTLSDSPERAACARYLALAHAAGGPRRPGSPGAWDALPPLPASQKSFPCTGHHLDAVEVCVMPAENSRSIAERAPARQTAALLAFFRCAGECNHPLPPVVLRMRLTGLSSLWAPAEETAWWGKGGAAAKDGLSIMPAVLCGTKVVARTGLDRWRSVLWSGSFSLTNIYVYVRLTPPLQPQMKAPTPDKSGQASEMHVIDNQGLQREWLTGKVWVGVRLGTDSADESPLVAPLSRLTRAPMFLRRGPGARGRRSKREFVHSSRADL
jgi:hypothetical protein